MRRLSEPSMQSTGVYSLHSGAQPSAQSASKEKNIVRGLTWVPTKATGKKKKQELINSGKKEVQPSLSSDRKIVHRDNPGTEDNVLDATSEVSEVAGCKISVRTAAHPHASNN